MAYSLLQFYSVYVFMNYESENELNLAFYGSLALMQKFNIY